MRYKTEEGVLINKALFSIAPATPQAKREGEGTRFGCADFPQTKPRATGQDTRFRKHKPQVSIMESKQGSLARKIKKQDYTNQER